MKVQAIQGYFDKGVFYQHGKRVMLPERFMVIINVLDIPINENSIPIGEDDQYDADIAFWKEFDKLAMESEDEFLEISHFPRTDLGRELVSLDWVVNKDP
jgi:hypothetical protein